MGIGPVELAIVVLFGGGLGIPLGIPPGPEDPQLARMAPEECLYFTTWAGTADADTNSPVSVLQNRSCRGAYLEGFGRFPQ